MNHIKLLESIQVNKYVVFACTVNAHIKNFMVWHKKGTSEKYTEFVKYTEMY